MTAASVMVIDAKGTAISRHWTPNITHKIKFKNEGDWIEAFQDLFFHVVKARMRTPTRIQKIRRLPSRMILNGAKGGRVKTEVTAEHCFMMALETARRAVVGPRFYLPRSF